MTESTQMWMEIIFNVTYLFVIWGLVITMYSRRESVKPKDRRTADLFMWAFGFLALGDTGHVGFRVVAYAIGDLNASISIFGLEMGLVGLGALATAITVTIFYILMLMIWQERFDKPYGWFGYLLFGAAIFRFVIMVFPANEWNSIVPPQPWGLIRNLPLLVQGLGLVYLILRDSQDSGDLTFKWIGNSILISYAMYIPVILFVHQVPMIGMLMIPKTMAYLAIAFIAYNSLYHSHARVEIGIETGD
jgi:hypothetical protein